MSRVDRILLVTAICAALLCGALYLLEEVAGLS